MPINIDDYLKHETYLARLASGEINSVVMPSLKETERAVVAILNERDLNTPARLRRVTRLVNEAIRDNAGWAQVTTDLEELADYEAGYTAEMITASTSVSVNKPAREKINQYMQTAMMSLTQGDRVNVGPWSEFVNANVDERTRQIDGLIRQGYMRGQPKNEIVRNIRTATTGLLARQAETLARTGYQHYANSARDAMAEDNSDVELDVVYSAVFDNRTTLGCRALNGERWPKGSPDSVEVPRHWNCRSSHLIVPRGEDVTGTRAAIGGESGEEAQEAYQRRKDRADGKVQYRGRRDSDAFDAGQIRASTPQDKWMKRQPAWFQNDALGPKRAKLLRSGDYDFDDFVDTQGRKLTLDELRARDAELFERLGI